MSHSSRSSSPSVRRRSNKKSSDSMKRFQYLELSRLDGMRRTEIGDYIDRLHRLLRRTVKKVKKYKERCSKLKRQRIKADSESQSSSSEDEKKTATTKDKALVASVTSSATDPKVAESNGPQPDATAVDEDPLSFVNDMKQAAQQMAGFVYEPTSGLYYDCKTGYYYNAEHNLYYDGNSGCYYDYDKAANKFVFHSQAYADDTESAAPSETKTATNRSSSNSNSSTSHTTVAEPTTNKKTAAAASTTKRKPSGARPQTPTRQHQRQPRRQPKRRRRGRRSSCSSASSDSGSNADEVSTDREDGELSSDDGDVSAGSVVFVGEAIDKSADQLKDECAESAPPVSAVIIEPQTYEDIARKYPPSLRLVVLETLQPKLRVGQLFMITYKGGTLGREGAHDVIIPDINVSKFHLTFKYNHDDSRYECTDLGSRNGTVLNGRRMSNAKQESDPLPVLHGTTISLSQTRLLCHVHEGHSTCDECEPGLLAAAGSSATTGLGATSAAHATAAGGTTEATTESYLTHKQELKQLKKRYGLADQKYLIQQSTMANDRSAQRRALVGSSDGNEKTQTASVETNIPVNNKGFKLLSKLGWSQGQKLGKNDSGLLEPVPLVSNTGTKGLGCDVLAPASSQLSASTLKRGKLMRITQKRYEQKSVVLPPCDLFAEDGQLDV